jgi:hypothetical protein
VAVDSAGYVYVSNSGADQVQKFTATGSLVTQWGSSGSGDGQFSQPMGMTVGPNGHLYVADYGANSRIQEFTTSGAFVGKWGSYGSGNGQFVNPYGAAINNSGDIFVPDWGNNRIDEFHQALPVITPASSNWSLALLAVAGLGYAEIVRRKTRKPVEA